MSFIENRLVIFFIFHFWLNDICNKTYFLSCVVYLYLHISQLIFLYRGYPAKRALFAMRKHVE